MAERPFMQLYGSDLVGDTLHLSAEQIGAYMLLIIAMWNAGGSLPVDATKLARIARCTAARWAKISPDLHALFETNGVEIWHKRVRKEIEKMNEKRAKNRASGSLGGKARALKTNDTPQANASSAIKRNSSIARATPEPEPDSEDIESSERAQRKRASRLKPDWSPSETDQSWLRDKWPGVSRSTYEAELEKFRNYWLAKSGKDATKLDWSRTWQNWMITAKDRAPSSPARSARQPVETVSQAARALREEIENAERQTSAGSDRTIDGRLSGAGERGCPPAIEHIPHGD